MLTIQSIQEAQARINPYIYKTPLLHLSNLDEDFGCQVHAKLESFQKTNSFKVRGALNALLSLPEDEMKKGIITASSGNHGKAIAYAAKQLGTKAYVVVPENTPKIKVEGIQSYGAEIIFSAPSERFQVANKLSEDNNWRFISPFDDYDIMAGQGTAGLEILEQLPDVDTIIVPIGGGGLISGLSTFVKETNPHVKIIGVEPTNVARYSNSFTVGHPVPLPKESKSVADGLQTLEPGKLNYPVVEKYVDEIVTVDEENILKATKLMLTKGKLVAEISSCITLGAFLQGAVKFNPNEKVVLFISGGNIDMDQFSKFEELSI
ncbi:threonine ammonia-lyase [Ureibacillus acetophenoni]|uniref:threonine ammonia-lyase n=1 Tax=Ureibacillus acetophenoni TaxID=614649 RepID=A0A285UFA5_9BACL|nr:threonine/serine dehydratase [Ureibacillus acetophenoni]SOC40605.1 threonine dehydratase [Ureibacillus acetophenoni]